MENWNTGAIFYLTSNSIRWKPEFIMLNTKVSIRRYENKQTHLFRGFKPVISVK
jgi:hypothetical protein